MKHSDQQPEQQSKQTVVQLGTPILSTAPMEGTKVEQVQSRYKTLSPFGRLVVQLLGFLVVFGIAAASYYFLYIRWFLKMYKTDEELEAIFGTTAITTFSRNMKFEDSQAGELSLTYFAVSGMLTLQFWDWTYLILFCGVTFVFTRFLASYFHLFVKKLVCVSGERLSRVTKLRLSYVQSIDKSIGLLSFAIIALSITTLRMPHPNLMWMGLLKSLVIASALHAAVSLLTRIFEAEFKLTTFGRKIACSNFSIMVLAALEKVANSGTAVTHSLAEITGKHHSLLTKSHEKCELAEVEFFNMLDDLQKFAVRIFVTLAGDDKEFSLSEFKTIFGPDDYLSAFEIFSPDTNKNIPIEAFRERIRDVVDERKLLEKTLSDNKKIVGKFQTLLYCLFGVIGTFLVLVQFSSAASTWFFSLGGVILGAGFLFQDTYKSLYHVFLFVFAVHPYDIGDSVTIDGDHLIVLGIDLFSTTFQKTTGDILYIQNHNFAGKSIINHARADVQTSRVQMVVDANQFQRIWELRDLLKRSDAKISVSEFVNGPGAFKVTINAEFKCVLTEEGKIKRQAEFSRAVEQAATALNIEHKIL